MLMSPGVKSRKGVTRNSSAYKTVQLELSFNIKPQKAVALRELNCLSLACYRTKLDKYSLMLPTHEMKTTHKFNGRKRVEDEVLEFPLRIMQSNIGDERYSHQGPKAQVPWKQPQHN